ncbi:MAG: NADH pyrophosphatase, partial [Brevundimonas sp.]
MPFTANTFAGNPLDRAGDRRSDPAWLAEQAAGPGALALALHEGRVLVEAHPDGPRLAWLDLSMARDLAPGREAFLGLWKDAPVFAVDLTEEISSLGEFIDLRTAASLLSGPDAAMAGTAKSLFDWRSRHGFCARCGQKTADASGGWKRICPACGAEHFPRVDPVTIMLPVFKGGAEPKCLLGRQAAWPAGRMSALAGFV